MFGSSKRTLLPLSLAFVQCIAVAAQNQPMETREQRELRMADVAILSSMMVSRNPQSRYLCANDPYACIGANQAELGIALIGARDTSASLSTLSKLLRYRLDGAIAEDFTCYVLQAGERIVPRFKEDPAAMERMCRDEVKEVVRTNPKLFQDFDAYQVCAKTEKIIEKREELIEAIRKGSKCSLGDF